MLGCFTYETLRRYLLQRVPVDQIGYFLAGEANLLASSSQDKVLSLLSKIAHENAFYVKCFLKIYISLIERRNETVADELYELYCSQEILGAVERGPTDYDTITYSISDKNTENSMVIIEENPRLISSQGTTGFRTWEAALFLSSYLMKSPHDLKNKTICDLGTGTGLVGLAVSKSYHQEVSNVKEVIFTDGNSLLLERLNYTLLLNNRKQGARTRSQQLLWGSTNPKHEDFVSPPPFADCVLAADVTYDSSILPQLASTILDFLDQGTSLCLIAATIRNTETISNWEKELNKLSGVEWCIEYSSVHPTEENFTCWFHPSTPEIRIYKIVPAKLHQQL